MCRTIPTSSESSSTMDCRRPACSTASPWTPRISRAWTYTRNSTSAARTASTPTRRAKQPTARWPRTPATPRLGWSTPQRWPRRFTFSARRTAWTRITRRVRLSWTTAGTSPTTIRARPCTSWLTTTTTKTARPIGSAFRRAAAMWPSSQGGTRTTTLSPTSTKTTTAFSTTASRITKNPSSAMRPIARSFCSALT